MSTTPILDFLDLQQPFQIQTDASGYNMGAVLMQQGKPICYHFETFTQEIINYST